MNFFVTYVLDSYTRRKFFTAALTSSVDFRNSSRTGLKQPKIFNPAGDHSRLNFQRGPNKAEHMEPHLCGNDGLYCILSPSKISDLRPRTRVNNFGLSERSEFPKFSAADRADRLKIFVGAHSLGYLAWAARKVAGARGEAPTLSWPMTLYGKI